MEFKSRKVSRCSACIGIALFVFMFRPILSPAQSQKLLEQAKKEGEVVLYTTMPVKEFQVFGEAAGAKYPFLTIRHVRISSASQVSKVMLEHRSGNMHADVLGNSLTAMVYFKNQGVIEKYHSSEAAQMVKGSVDPEGHWTGITTDLLVTAFSSQQMTPDRAPKNFDDYLDPRFKGQMAVNQGVPYGLIGMIELRGEEKGLAYMKQLGRQGVRPVEGFTHMTNLLAAGEYSIAIFMQVSKIEAMKKKGGPVDWLPTSPTLATISTVGITRQAPHPSAAKVLVDFYISVEGQKALAAAGKIPLRRGVKSPSEEIDKLLDGGNLHVLKAEGEYSWYMKLYNEALGMK